MKPSTSFASVLTIQAKVASPDCLSAFGRLGAESSFTTNQFAVPFPVTPLSHSGGNMLGAKSSKFTFVSASARWATTRLMTVKRTFLNAVKVRASGMNVTEDCLKKSSAKMQQRYRSEG